MKLLHVLSKSIGGIRQHVGALDFELEARGISSSIVGPKGVMAGLADQEGSFTTPTLKNPLTFYFASREIRRQSQNVDVIHAHGVTAGYLTAVSQLFKKNPIKIILTLHNLVHPTIDGPKYKFKRTLQSFILSKVDFVICPSTFSLNQLNAKSRDVAKYRVVLPVSRVFSAEEKQDARKKIPETRAKYSVTENDMIMVCLARTVPQKDLKTLVNAMSLLCEKSDHFKLLIAGGGTVKSRHELLECIHELGVEKNIHLLGPVSSAIELISIGNILVLSSIYETVPLVVIEALQLGVPVVMTETGIASEILNGECGDYVPVGDSFKLAEAIETWCKRASSNTIDRQAIINVANDWVNPQKCVQPLVDLYTFLSGR